MTRRVLGTAAVAGLVGTVLVYVGALPHGLALNVVVVLAAAAALAVLCWNVSDGSTGLGTATWYVHDDAETAPLPQIDGRLMRLRRDLRDTVERSDRGDSVHPLLLELTEERLWARHDVSLLQDAERARTLLPEDLYRYLTTPPGPRSQPTARALHVLIDRIEAL